MGNEGPAEDCGGERYVDKSFGNGGTGGTSCPVSGCSLDDTSDAARSFKKATSPDCEASLPTLLRLALLVEWRPDCAETEVRLVPADIDPESLELVVGVLVYVVDEAEPRLAVKLSRTLAEDFFVGGLSCAGELSCVSSLLPNTLPACSEVSKNSPSPAP